MAGISPDLINATVATEDRNFWLHPGFDPIAIARAIYYNISEQRIVSGASTIPQQLARNVLLTPEERVQQTTWRKIKEAVLAAELFRTYDREIILEIYLNEIYYGNQAYGIQAAAERNAEIVVIDPRRTDTAKRTAARWVPIRPGTDAAMMCAMAYVIVQEGLHDREFIASHCVGFDSHGMPPEHAGEDPVEESETPDHGPAVRTYVGCIEIRTAYLRNNSG